LNRVSRTLCHLLALVGGLTSAVTAHADALSAVQVLREGGCGGTLPAAAPADHNLLLDRAAEQWAAGSLVATAMRRSGYQAQSTAAIHISGPEAATIQLLRRANCSAVADRGLREIGVFQRGSDTWVLLARAQLIPTVYPATLSPTTLSAAPAPAPAPRLSTPKAPPLRATEAPVVASRVLQLVNEVRARGARCGDRAFAPVPPVRLSDTLASVALGHAVDMADHDYFEHEDLSGRSPADRVKAVGYKEKLVGENIAYGPDSADEVVQGWLDSPGHCENIMDARFAEMGIAFAAGESSRHGLYWVQLLVAPRV
jgi:uncharacterized protein YkwD